MHIPDSAISPTTSLAAGAAMLPVWYAAGRRVHDTLAERQVPLLAIGAAFCFTVMMFNIPVPGGTTVHPVGGALLAVLLGPWAAVIGVTVALAIQALFFADGGVMAIGANSFTMAFAMPVVGYLVYRLACGRAPSDGRRALAAGIGAYVGVNAAAALTAVLLGIQPALFRDAVGRPEYFPYGLRAALPAMLIPHLAVAGVAEGVVTTLVVRYLQRAGIPLFGAGGQTTGGGRRETLWLGLAGLAALTPLGLLATGDAWGEWSAGDLAHRVGYLPRGIAATESHGWKGFGLLPDYLSERGPLFYVLAAAAGIALTSVLLWVAGLLLARRNRAGSAPPSAGGREPNVEPGEIPGWMRSADDGPVADGSSRAPRDFAEKTLADLAGAMREVVFGETWAGRSGLLQALDARAKVLGLLGCVALVSWLRHPGVVAAVYCLALLLAAASRIPLGVVLRRVWLTVPVFAAAVVLPAALNLVAPGRPLLTLWRHPLLAVTAPGLEIAGTLLLRIGVAVTFVVLLTLTTRWQDLLGALRVLFVPRMFIVVLAMTYRYLAVLAQAATDMFMARKSRTVGRASVGDQRRFLGGAAGALFGKTLALTDEVHHAMLSRGWTGEAKTLRPPRLRTIDLLWLAGAAAAACAAVAAQVLL